ncbi:MAG: antibiotic biosynthesis monooxygenase [Ignavibacteria bacterium]|nr:antibiotic biosynthesis monooxygenase [Ignavibacteria bacterium]
MRLLQIMVNPDFEMQFQHFYKYTVIPELQNREGCRLVNLIKGSNEPGHFISLTLWEELQQAEQYVKSDAYKKLSEEVKPFLSQSNEWKIQLTNDLELEYIPVAEQPTPKEYVVAVQTDSSTLAPQQGNDLFVRIVSAKIQEGMVDEFKDIYSSEIIPVLKATRGCLYAFLSENLKEMDEFLSVSIWNSKAEADEYENSGMFEELTNKVKHTFSRFYLWKMTLEQETKGEIKTSEDMKIDHYTMIAGKSFN